MLELQANDLFNEIVDYIDYIRVHKYNYITVNYIGCVRVYKRIPEYDYKRRSGDWEGGGTCIKYCGQGIEAFHPSLYNIQHINDNINLRLLFRL